LASEEWDESIVLRAAQQVGDVKLSQPGFIPLLLEPFCLRSDKV
jgi:hypothetical protein